MDYYYAYIRVSTPRQGEHGVSLQEQRDAISRFAERHGLVIKQWFEEQETAAKRGRRVFSEMLELLEKGAARGVVMHKIDRSARNLSDWSQLGELIDRGVVVHFAAESLDLSSRGGRLSADIQAVVAADYIRNLREEIRKGFYGRLKQGLLPLPAPVGYLDRGKGRPKEPDPDMAPLVRKAFKLYSSRQHSLRELVEVMDRLGLRTKRGGRLTISSLSWILNNPFYIGMIRVHRTGQRFSGVHEPIVSVETFNRVQLLLRGRTRLKVVKHEFLFRGVFRCGTCHRLLTGERVKGYVYYRCHGRHQPPSAVRDHTLESEVGRQLRRVSLDPREQRAVEDILASLEKTSSDELAKLRQGLELSLKRVRAKSERLADAYLEGVLDRGSLERKRIDLSTTTAEIERRLREIPNAENGGIVARLRELFQLAQNAWLTYESGNPREKRDLLEIMSSNCEVVGKDVSVELSFPFSTIANRTHVQCGGPYRNRVRTFSIKNESAEIVMKRVVDEMIEGLSEGESFGESEKKAA